MVSVSPGLPEAALNNGPLHFRVILSGYCAPCVRVSVCGCVWVCGCVGVWVGGWDRPQLIGPLPTEVVGVAALT